MKILSLCGGIECVRVALQRAGIPVEAYWSSEIDPHAIKVTAHNWPDVVHLGDIVKFRRYFCGSEANVEAMKASPYVTPKTLATIAQVQEMKKRGVDMICAGFPCTDLSLAGKQTGLHGTRSGIFWECLRILEECKKINPEILYLFENVPMAKRYQRAIDEALGISPHKANAARVCAQNRTRLWWSNIRTKTEGLFGDLVTDFPVAPDRGIMLAHILEKYVPKRYNLSERAMERIDLTLKRGCGKIGGDKAVCQKANADTWTGQFVFADAVGVVNDMGDLRRVEKSSCVDANYHKGIDKHAARTAVLQTPRGFNAGGFKAKDGKAPTVGANSWERNNHVFCLNKMRTEHGKRVRKDYEAGNIPGARRSDMRAHLPRGDGKTGTVTTVEADNLLFVKSPCVHGMEHGTNGNFQESLAGMGILRRLTEREVGRLFGLPSGYFTHRPPEKTGRKPRKKNIVAPTHQYRLMGNGMVVPEVERFFRLLPEKFFKPLPTEPGPPPCS